ncbi:MAG TPA: PilN domain-containing protein [Rhodocyclaceae bacterium]|nr:PilN domain-containing protein [Rhodocyclaceae bacterium]
MSQQINLLNPALRPRRDWLSLPAVVAVVALILLVEGGLYAKARFDQADLNRQQEQLTGENKRIQEQLLVLSKSLSEQRADPALAELLESRQAEAQAGEELLQTLRSLQKNTAGFSGYLQGFSRQTMDGLWLTGFSFGADGLSIKGRMQDSNLLPVYIRRLNGEPTFQGRQFSALDMKAVEPPKANPGAGKAASDPVLPAYTEFTLQGVLSAPEGGKP